MFIQNGFLVGKLLSVTIKEFEGKNGKQYTSLNALVRTPEGAALNVDKLIEMKENISDYFSDAIAKYQGFVERLENKEQIYVMASIKPGKGNVMFDKISTYQNDEGKISLKFGGLVAELEHYMTEATDEEDAKVMIKFTKKEEAFDDIKTTFTIQMIVQETSGEDITFSDFNETYAPTQLIASLPEGTENRAVIGQGYSVIIAPVKGKVIKSATGNTMEWGADAKTTYASDYFEIKNVVGVVKGYTSNVGDSNSDSNSLLY